jgi:GT2 family glycosyltransferase
MDQNPLVYIILLNYNNYNLTYECISSLKRLSYSNYRILVVDDSPFDTTIERLSVDFPDVKLIQNKKNLNYCISFNVGIRAALEKDAQFIFLVNNDTKNFSTNYIEQIIYTFNENPRIGLVGSRCYDYDGGVRLGDKPSIRFGIDFNVPTEGYVIKREVFDKIGLLNENLVIYFEDLDFIFRMKRAGYITKPNLSISFDHLGGGAVSKKVFSSNYYRIRNSILMTRKYCGEYSIKWQIKEIKGNLGVHFRKLLSLTKNGQILLSFKTIFAIILGVSAGFLTPKLYIWKE